MPAISVATIKPLNKGREVAQTRPTALPLWVENAVKRLNNDIKGPGSGLSVTGDCTD